MYVIGENTMSRRDDYEKKDHPELIDEILSKEYDPFAEHSTNWPLCRVGDQGIFYIFMSIIAMCATAVTIMVIFTFWLVPTLVG